MIQKPMAQYLHNPEDQQGTEIFSCGAGVSWKQLGKNNPSVLLTNVKQQSRLKHSESAPATAAISKVLLQQWFVEGSLRGINVCRSPRDMQLLYRH